MLAHRLIHGREDTALQGGDRMSGLTRWIGSALLVAIVFALGACASGGGQSHGDMVAVRDVQSIAGRWAGIIESSGRQPDDFVDVTVNADGSYQAGGARTIGVFEGRGRIDVQDGRLRLTGERSTGLGTLYEKAGKRTLVFAITTSNGRQFTARLSPQP
jgi:hypothetical protein